MKDFKKEAEKIFVNSGDWNRTEAKKEVEALYQLHLQGISQPSESHSTVLPRWEDSLVKLVFKYVTEGNFDGSGLVLGLRSFISKELSRQRKEKFDQRSYLLGYADAIANRDKLNNPKE